jgi:hypothetical protein
MKKKTFLQKKKFINQILQAKKEYHLQKISKLSLIVYKPLDGKEK